MPGVTEFDSNGTNIGLFKISFQYILTLGLFKTIFQYMLTLGLFSVHFDYHINLSHLGPICNLTRLEASSGIPFAFCMPCLLF